MRNMYIVQFDVLFVVTYSLYVLLATRSWMTRPLKLLLVLVGSLPPSHPGSHCKSISCRVDTFTVGLICGTYDGGKMAVFEELLYATVLHRFAAGEVGVDLIVIKTITCANFGRT